jgi:Helix-turn-helix domain
MSSSELALAPPGSSLFSSIARRRCVTAPEVAEKLGIHVRTVHIYAKGKFIPGGFQVKGKWLFKGDELEAWWRSVGGKPLI